jgi:hypothetical protein
LGLRSGKAEVGLMNAHNVVASLLALARSCGSASKELGPGVDHEVTETAAVFAAKLGLELEHRYQLDAPRGAPVCEDCAGSRVVHVACEDPGGYEMCTTCGGRGFR